MKRLLPLLLLASCNRTPDDPSLPQWSDEQIASLKHWAEAAPLDALPRFDTAALDEAASGWDRAITRRAATELAEQLANAHLRGCAAPGERSTWQIEDNADSVGLRSRLKLALEGENNLDSFFASLRPAHPQYAGLQAAYAAETDPARRLVLARNLERWRWMPQSLGEDYVLVNVPGFEVGLWRNGALERSWPAVVGKTSTPTPTFASEINSVTFNPWWEVPPSIVREGGIAGRRGYVRTKSGRFRQPPGPRNALGMMKVEMPNRHAVYLHDTPARALFDRPERSFSSGCIRVEDPLALAVLVLDDPRWDRPALEAAIATGETRQVPLRIPVPVLIVYLTSIADPSGTVHFFRDVYGRDAPLLAALNGPVRLELPVHVGAAGAPARPAAL